MVLNHSRTGQIFIGVELLNRVTLSPFNFFHMQYQLQLFNPDVKKMATCEKSGSEGYHYNGSVVTFVCALNLIG